MQEYGLRRLSCGVFILTFQEICVMLKNMKKSMKIYKNCSQKTLYSLCWRPKLKSKESVYKILGSHMNTVVPFGGVEAI